MLDTKLLTSRVKGKVKYLYFYAMALWYICEDGYEFCVPVEDTTNGQGDSPKFLPEDKGIVFMRWIRKQMERTEELLAQEDPPPGPG